MIHGLFKSEIIGGARGWEFFLQGGSFFIGREWLESNNFANFNQKSSLIAPLIFKSEIIGGSREWLESHNFERFIALSLLFIAAYVPTYFIHIYLLLFPFVVSHVYRHLHTSNIFIFFLFSPLFFLFLSPFFSPTHFKHIGQVCTEQQKPNWSYRPCSKFKFRPQFQFYLGSQLNLSSYIAPVHLEKMRGCIRRRRRNSKNLGKYLGAVLKLTKHHGFLRQFTCSQLQSPF